MEIEIMTTESVAKLLKTTPSKVNAMIRNGTLPIGAAVRAGEDGEGSHNRSVIIKKRLEAWLNGDDLKRTS
jgi:hypothetical protein